MPQCGRGCLFETLEPQQKTLLLPKRLPCDFASLVHPGHVVHVRLALVAPNGEICQAQDQAMPWDAVVFPVSNYPKTQNQRSKDVLSDSESRRMIFQISFMEFPCRFAATYFDAPFYRFNSTCTGTKVGCDKANCLSQPHDGERERTDRTDYFVL